MKFKEHILVFLEGLKIFGISCLVVSFFVTLLFLLTISPAIVGGCVIGLFLCVLIYFMGLFSKDAKL